MNRLQIMKLRQELCKLNELFEVLQADQNPYTRNSLNTELKKKIADIKSRLPSSKDISYSATQLKQDFAELEENYQTFIASLEEEDRKAEELFQTFEEEIIDLEEEQKKAELTQVKEAAKVSYEMMKVQEKINEQLLKDTENLETAIDDTESTISTSHKMVENLAEAAKEERKKRGLYLTTGGSVVGGVLGQGLGGVLGFIIGGGISKLIGKRHDNQIKKVLDMK